jgi:hypothetical protein
MVETPHKKKKKKMRKKKKKDSQEEHNVLKIKLKVDVFDIPATQKANPLLCGRQADIGRRNRTIDRRRLVLEQDDAALEHAIGREIGLDIAGKCQFAIESTRLSKGDTNQQRQREQHRWPFFFFADGIGARFLVLHLDQSAGELIDAWL